MACVQVAALFMIISVKLMCEADMEVWLVMFWFSVECLQLLKLISGLLVLKRFLLQVPNILLLYIFLSFIFVFPSSLSIQLPGAYKQFKLVPFPFPKPCCDENVCIFSLTLELLGTFTIIVFFNCAMKAKIDPQSKFTSYSVTVTWLTCSPTSKWTKFLCSLP